MELYWVWMSAASLFTFYIFVNKIVRRLNEWYYDLKLRKKQLPLPPGDMGLPLIGNLLAFMKDYLSGRPDTFITNLVSKYGRIGIYKTHLFFNPSIIVCDPEMSKRVLNDDENFKFGYPKCTTKLSRSRLFNLSGEERKRYRRILTAPIMGHNVLAKYTELIEEIVINSLEEMSSMKHPVQILKEMKKISLKTIIHIFLGSYNQHIVTQIADLFTDVNDAMFVCIPINLPGFSFRKALKARERLVNIVQYVVDERKLMIKNDQTGDKKYLIDILLHLNDQNDQKLEDEEIIDLLLVFLFAGGESTATGMMMSVAYLTQHPLILKKAKDEQEEIMKARPPSQNQLSLTEIKQMIYLSQVIDEMLRRANLNFSIFREATTDININGYMIPKGWRVLVWTRAIHMNPENYSNPEEFNPSRWNDYKAKPGTFIPFGVGSRLCPGSDLAKLEISIFLHYFLLNYKLELMNPEYSLTYFPAPKLIQNCLAKVKKISFG